MKTLKLDNPDMIICVASMGKMHRVTAVCKGDDEANEVCRKNPDTGVIAKDCNGLIYIAELYGKTINSQVIKDFFSK